MSEQDINRVFPDWNVSGSLCENAFGKVYLIEKTNGEETKYASVKVISVPRSEDAVSYAIELGVSHELLRLYFDSFKQDLRWELKAYRIAVSENVIDEIIFEDNENGLGWKAYIRFPLLMPLDDYLKVEGKGNDNAVRMALSILDSVETLAAYGLVHGGISPDTVAVTENGDFVLRDYGVKRLLTHDKLVAEEDRWSEYDAPEVVSSREYTNVSDIYSVGKTMKFAAGEEILPELAEIAKKAAAESPDDRYANAAEMKAELLKIGVAPASDKKADVLAYALAVVNGLPFAAAPETDEAEIIEEVAEIGEITAVEEITEAEERTEIEDIVEEEIPAVVPPDVTENAATEKKNDFSRFIKFIPYVAACAVIAAAVLIGKPWEKNEPVVPVTPDTHEEHIDDTPTTQDSPDTPNTPDVPDIPNTPDNPDTSDTPDVPDITPTDVPDPRNDPTSGNGDDYERQTESYRNSYIFDSSEKEITVAQLRELDRDGTYMALNELYARHGKIFSDPTVQQYFEAQEWYTPTTYSSDKAYAAMNGVERTNHRIIIAYQREMGYRSAGAERVVTDNVPEIAPEQQPEIQPGEQPTEETQPTETETTNE